MNVKFLKTTLAVVCVVAAGAGSWKAYSTYDSTHLLLQENIEALSGDDVQKYEAKKCYINESEKGENVYICHEGTTSYVVYDCPNQTKKADMFSESGFCMKKIN